MQEPDLVLEGQGLCTIMVVLRPESEALAQKLRELDFRVSVDRRSEKVGAKIRDARVDKVPYMAVLGPRDVAAGVIAVRSRAAGDLGALTMENLVERLRVEVATRATGITDMDPAAIQN